MIAKFPALDFEELSQDAEGGRVTYVFVQGGPGQQGRQQRGTVKHSSARVGVAQPLQGYGTTAPMAPSVHQEENGTWGGAAGEGSSGGPAPPPYEQAIGDHKVQTRD